MRKSATLSSLLQRSISYWTVLRVTKARQRAQKAKPPRGKGVKVAVPGGGGSTPLDIAPTAPNPHHFIVAPQCALPVDAAGNPWSGSYVYASSNLVLDLMYNLMLESTGRLQKCRIYEMPRLNFAVQHGLVAKEALIWGFVSMSFSRSVVDVVRDQVAVVLGYFGHRRAFE